MGNSQNLAVDFDRKPDPPCISDKTVFIAWNSLLVLDTLSQYLVKFVWKDSFEYGIVTQWVALTLGTVLSLVFIQA